uniref:store-operated calcium entry-associated regulatory factor-like isoform X1 n=1 Tax=Myxine glutinosa TaxID=7769 RepID=UPI00358ED543
MALSCLLLLFSISACALCFGRDRVLLSDVQVLTLRRGAFTSARRSDPIPHLRCIGGSAGCPTNTPDVVQCTNRGSDGDDIQWECKASMESTYRFGRIEVSCEGYDYADDPYILQGSCGLEYTLESTGKQSSFGSHDSGGGYGWRNPSPSGGLGLGMSDGVSSLVILLLLAGVVFFIYKMVLAPANSNGGDSVPGMAPGMGPGMAPGMGPGMAPGMGPGMAPGMGPGAPGMGQGYGTGPAHPPSAPSYGFKEEYMRQEPPPSYEQSNRSSSTHRQASSGSGFWTGLGTGLGTGGLMGYLLGNRGSSRSNWFGSSYGGGYSSQTRHSHPTFSSAPPATRTDSGFGGTKRR